MFMAMMPYITPLQDFEVPVIIQTTVTPKNRVFLKHFSLHIVPYEHDEYRHKNPSFKNRKPLEEASFLKRRYNHIESITQKVKKKDGSDYQKTVVLPGKGEYMVYFFFKETTRHKDPRGFAVGRQEHFFIKKIWYGGKGALVVNLTIEETQPGKPVSTDVSIFLR
jgi:hypothetical protein